MPDPHKAWDTTKSRKSLSWEKISEKEKKLEAVGT